MVEISCPLTLKVDDDEFERAVEKAIENHPDYVMVVRCKDCIHYRKNALRCNINFALFAESHYNWYEEDFCSYGERKKDNA